MIETFKRPLARASIAIAQNRLALGFVGLWVIANAAVFHFVRGLDGTDAILDAICVQKESGTWGHFYAAFTEVVVFGAIASFVVANVTRHYRPEATCAALARQARDHVLVIGHSHLGERVHDMALSAGVEVVVVESDRSLVEELVRTEAPLVLGSAREEAVLADAGVAHAAVVVVATNDLEEAAVACRTVRARNPRCELIVRCADDDVGKVLARAYGARAISTSKIAAAFIGARAAKIGARRALVVGSSALGERVAATLRASGMTCLVVDGVAALEAAPLKEIDLVFFADDDLGHALVHADRVRDVNASAEIIARVFHEDAAQILTQAPLRCTLLSTSRLAAQSLLREGLLRRVADRDAKAARAAMAA